MKKILLVILLVLGCNETITHNHKHGCLDIQATNYDSTAVIDNNSCEYDQIEETTYCALKYTYYRMNYDIDVEYYRCVEDVSEALCLYKAEHGCNEWYYGQGFLLFDEDSCASDLTYYGTWTSIHNQDDNCDEFCERINTWSEEHYEFTSDNTNCSTIPFVSGP